MIVFVHLSFFLIGFATGYIVKYVSNEDYLIRKGIKEMATMQNRINIIREVVKTTVSKEEAYEILSESRRIEIEKNDFDRIWYMLKRYDTK